MIRFADFVDDGRFEDHFHPSHREYDDEVGGYVASKDIDPDVFMHKPPFYVAEEVTMGARTQLDYGVEVHFRAKIGDSVFLGRNAIVGADVYVGDGAFIAEGARLDPRMVPFREDDVGMDEQYTGIEPNAIIGQGVVIASGVSIPADMVVPHPDSIMTFSHHGSSNSTVTVLGSEEGPRYVVRCQRAIDIETFRERVRTSDDTLPASAQRYVPYVKRGGPFESAGMAVQKIFERELNHVAELRATQRLAHVAVEAYHESLYSEVFDRYTPPQ